MHTRSHVVRLLRECYSPLLRDLTLFPELSPVRPEFGLNTFVGIESLRGLTEFELYQLAAKCIIFHSSTACMIDNWDESLAREIVTRFKSLSATAEHDVNTWLAALPRRFQYSDLGINKFFYFQAVGIITGGYWNAAL